MNMNDAERREWLSNLKEEDKVANEHYNTWRGGSYYEIYTVKKITATGKIRLDNGVLLAMTFLCYLFRENFFACVGQTFLFVWLCQALLLYLLFDFFLLGKFLLFRIQKKKTENAPKIMIPSKARLIIPLRSANTPARATIIRGTINNKVC